MRPRRTQRGSAYLYVIVCVSVMGLLATQLIPFITQARTTQARRQTRVTADFATESLVQQVTAEALVQPIVSNATRTLTLNGATVTATVNAGDSVVPNSYAVVGTTAVDGQTFRFTRYVTQGVGASAYSFAIYTASDMTWAGRIITGTAGKDGDVFCNGKIDLRTGGAHTVNGNISAQNTVQLASGSTITGNTIPGSSSVDLPTFSALTYYTNASYVMNGPMSSTSGASFSGTVNGHYPIYYINGNVNFQGSISGIGVVFVNGNITFTGNVTYANSSSRVALIATGNITVNAACTQGAGIIFAGGSFIVNSPDYNVTRGIIVANRITNGPIIRATRDNFMQTSSTEGTKLCLPGYWP